MGSDAKDVWYARGKSCSVLKLTLQNCVGKMKVSRREADCNTQLTGLMLTSKVIKLTERKINTPPLCLVSE